MNIIIPLGGLGVRFQEEHYLMPKPLIKVLGKELIFHLLDRLILLPEDKVYMIISRELEKFNFSGTIHSIYPHLKILFLDKQTEGAAETVLIGLNQIENLGKIKERKTVLLDCDNFYTCDILKKYREMGEDDNAIVCFRDNQSNPIYSYLSFDEKRRIKEIKEKVRISDFANTGCYCFSDIALLKQYCMMCIEKNIRQKNEYYISGVVQKMIDDGYDWRAIEIDIENYHCLGTPFQLKLYCNKNLLEGEKKRICFDLDNTLVTSPVKANDYSSVLPIIKNIEYLRFLKKLGHTIIIYTARRMKTHGGNLGKIIQDVGKVTIDTLEKFDIPHDELYFGKPYANFYIDDLAVNACFDLEKELGIYKTDIKERSFNELSSGKIEVITKKSQSSKIRGEIYWYQNIPTPLRDLFPALISYGNDYYVIEKIHGITLSYLFVNESLSETLFQKFLQSIERIHSSAITIISELPKESKIGEEKIDIYANYAKKLEERYKSYDYSKIDPSVQKVYTRLLSDLREYEKEEGGIRGLIHGDPVFSNVLIDNHNNIKLIDMRGMQGETLTLEGDILYDYAKIYQSLIGYDEILLDKRVSSKYRDSLICLFTNFIRTHYGEDCMEKVEMITNSLIFSLIPLHNNDKCHSYYKLMLLPQLNK